MGRGLPPPAGAMITRFLADTGPVHGQRETRRHSTAFLTQATSLNFALIVLNVDHRQRSSALQFDCLWDRASLRVCADGAANRLYDSLTESTRRTMLPDVISGDLDSIRGDVANFYSAEGVPLAKESEQETNDFEKCLRWIERRAAGKVDQLTVVAIGAFGGRLDQQMANLNTAYTHTGFRDFYLVSEHSVAFVLQPGLHEITPNPDAEDGTCGLVPLGGRCDGVRTTGLRWNLCGDRPLEFGSLISSSNRIVEPLVTVDTQSPLLWTTGIASSQSCAGAWLRGEEPR
ncbi:hypothetical protein AB1Y20_018151 [Prymnesium parvum]|uniref:Thiamine pyrophosphokinase n=2 Tax=Prymnesium parvum TaxID=97485 RepID=A0AB34JQ39_PRYPA